VIAGVRPPLRATGSARDHVAAFCHFVDTGTGAINLSREPRDAANLLAERNIISGPGSMWHQSAQDQWPVVTDAGVHC
jgi:hypothetical protein